MIVKTVVWSIENLFLADVCFLDLLSQLLETSTLQFTVTSSDFPNGVFVQGSKRSELAECML